MTTEIYGTIPEFVWTTHDALAKIDSLSADERARIIHMLRIHEGAKGSDDEIISRYRLSLANRIN